MKRRFAAVVIALTAVLGAAAGIAVTAADTGEQPTAVVANGSSWT